MNARRYFLRCSINIEVHIGISEVNIAGGYHSRMDIRSATLDNFGEVTLIVFSLWSRRLDLYSNSV